MYENYDIFNTKCMAFDIHFKSIDLSITLIIHVLMSIY